MSSLPVTQVFFALFFFTQVMCIPSNKNIALIEQVCKKTHDYNLCFASLKSDPRGLNADLKNLVVIMMDVSIVKAIEIAQLIDKLNKTTSDPSIKSCLKLCGLQYELSVGDFQKAIHAFESSSFKESYEYLTFSTIGQSECEDCFAEPPASKSPLTATNAYFVSLVEIAEDILSIFMKHK